MENRHGIHGNVYDAHFECNVIVISRVSVIIFDFTNQYFDVLYSLLYSFTVCSVCRAEFGVRPLKIRFKTEKM